MKLIQQSLKDKNAQMNEELAEREFLCCIFNTHITYFVLAAINGICAWRLHFFKEAAKRGVSSF